MPTRGSTSGVELRLSWADAVRKWPARCTRVAITDSRRMCAAGSYNVLLVVTDKDGGIGSDERTVTVPYLGVSIDITPTWTSARNAWRSASVMRRSTAMPHATELLTVLPRERSLRVVATTRRTTCRQGSCR